MKGHWSPEDEFILRRLYPNAQMHELQAALGRDRISIRNKAIKLRLRKSARFMAGKTHRFKPGSEPFNKGLKRGRGWAPGRMADGQFIKGQPPHNQNPVGHERITKDGYLEIKVRDTRRTRHDYEAAHRLVWERERGPIPAGYIVVFKPGRRTTEFREITVDRLECISRAENMRRNSYHTRYPELASIIQLRGALNRKINNRGNHAKQAQ